MVRPSDPFWAHAEEMNDGTKKCRFCGHAYTRGTSVSRFKRHLAGLQRAGVKICEMVPKAVQEAARAAIDGRPGKKLKTVASSSNNETDNRTASTSLEIENEMADCSPTSALEWMQRHIGEIELHAEGISSGDLLENTNVGLMQYVDAPDLEEMHGSQVYSSTVVDDGSMSAEGNMNREPEQHAVRDGFDGLLHIANENRGDPFPTPKLVGGEFEKYKNAIWSRLMNDGVSFIGIYGMGGVGKSTLVRHIYNQLLDTECNYCQAYWVTVSQDFSIYRLQNLIAKCMGLDLSNEEEEMAKAAKLSKVLAKKQKFVLILDDLWHHFDPKMVGIPSKMNGCKLIITTRSLDVCRQMGCEKNVIKVQPLLKEEAWHLFTMELGNYDIKLEPLAKSVASECDGLPLGIKTMASSMRGVYDVCEWRNTLEELKESKVRQSDMEPEVFRILKFSYIHLNDSALQQCFLYCALFPEDFKIKRVDLIEFLIVERIIEGKKSRQAEFDKGHQMLNQLENACLLESVIFEGESAVKMHDLVRDMAIQEMREKSHVMVEAGEQLEELPDEEKWSQDLVRVSLMQNYIKKIPSSHSPWCPNLSTILLCRNLELEFVGDSFFKKLHRLEVLDLSHTAIQKLPDSISYLASLTVLLLANCYSLNHVPLLANLKALKKLDLYNTALREVPPGLELLTSLRYLNLKKTQIEELPGGSFRHLQVLILGHRPYREIKMTVKAEELAFLTKLETLDCHSSSLLDFNKNLKSLSAYMLLIGQISLLERDFMLYNGSKEDLSRRVYLCGSKVKSYGDSLELPKGIQELAIGACPDMRSLCDFYALQHATQLKSLIISNCCSMECLVPFSQLSFILLGTVEALHLHYLDKLYSLCSKGAAPTSLPCNGMFSHLRTLKISRCPRMNVLFPPCLLQNLQNLEMIDVHDCFNLEEIIAKEESNVNSSSDLGIEFSLPKLRILKLWELPALMSIGCGNLICNSLQQIIIRYCERLKRLPFSCSPLTLKVVEAFPKEWWESVKWDEKNDYTAVFERW